MSSQSTRENACLRPTSTLRTRPRNKEYAHKGQTGETLESQVFFLTGPTAVGKTAIAQRIAERHDFDILCADSMLVYHGMDIGTAKPSVAEQSKVHYWGIDLVSPLERFSVGHYRVAALQAIQTVITKGRKLIVTGGTGLYIKSLTDGLDSRPPMNTTIRLNAEHLLKEKGVSALQEWLENKDSTLYKSLSDKNNPRRLIRALECACAEGTHYSKHWKFGKSSPRIPGLMLPYDQLCARIESRVRTMYRKGLIEEVEHLLQKGFDSSSTARQAIGYAEAVNYLKGRCSIKQAVNQTIIRTRHLAKRQKTWFRHQAYVDWIYINDSMSIHEIAQYVLDYWKCHGPTPVKIT